MRPAAVAWTCASPGSPAGSSGAAMPAEPPVFGAASARAASATSSSTQCAREAFASGNERRHRSAAFRARPPDQFLPTRCASRLHSPSVLDNSNKRAGHNVSLEKPILLLREMYKHCSLWGLPQNKRGYSASFFCGQPFAYVLLNNFFFFNCLLALGDSCGNQRNQSGASPWNVSFYLAL
uniref:Putative secreted protein n=1 Tax=Ixodes ricinus TaxID=34613 RepID=A0A6B0V062_IXORI